MGRSYAKDSYYFPHDYNARSDPKVMALRSVYGAEGYAVYFMLLEIMREQPSYRLTVNKYLWDTLSMQLGVDGEKIKRIVEDCCTEFSDGGRPLLINDGESIYSLSLLRRMEAMEKQSVQRKRAAEARWQKEKCSGNAPALREESKEENTKEEKTKEDKTIKNKRREKKTKDKNTFCGDDDEARGEIEEYFRERRMDISGYLGTTDELRKETAELTAELFSSLTVRKPTAADEADVFLCCCERTQSSDGQWKAYLDRDRTQLLFYAFEQASAAGHAGEWPYIRGVLARLHRRGIRTLADAEDYDCERKAG